MTDHFPHATLMCTVCSEATPNEAWIDTETYCDDCGSHQAVVCPSCNEVFDMVWHEHKIVGINE